MSIWDKHQESMQHHFSTSNIEDFLNWSTVQATMFVGDAPYIPTALSALKKDSYWSTWNYAIKDSWVGKPTPSKYKSDTTGNNILTAYHIKIWEDTNSKSIDKLTNIVEIGAGYGALARIIKRLGFYGDYYIYDLPEMIKLQKYYLSKNKLDKKVHWNSINLPKKVDLFIALFSLSEIEKEECLKYLNMVKASYYFIGLDISHVEIFDTFALNHGFTWKKIPGLLQSVWYLMNEETL